MQQRRQDLDRLGPPPGHVHGRHVGGLVGHDAHRGQDRVDEPVEALDLLQRGVVPGRTLLTPGDVARRAALQGGLLGQQVGVGADDRERRAQLVRHEGHELAAGLVDGLQGDDPRLGLRLLAALLDDAGQEVGHRAELGHVAVR